MDEETDTTSTQLDVTSNKRPRHRPGPPCVLCVHTQRPEIDLALARDELSCRAAARRYDVDPKSVWRHRNGHINPQLAEAAGHSASAMYDVEQLVDLLKQTATRLQAFMDSGETNHKLMAFGEYRRYLETLHRIITQHDERQAERREWQADPEWQRVQRVIVEALRPFDEARAAVLGALQAAGALDGNVIEGEIV